MIPMLTAHGASIPSIGFGTSQLGDCTDVVATALQLGYRHIDTAWKYGSEQGVGNGIKKSGVARQDIFLTTKVSHEYLRAADFARSVEESLSRLQTDYVDLLLVHWPTIDNIPLAETIGALAKARREGKTRFIGVANFNIALLDEAMRLCPEQFSVLQAEYHPYLDQSKMLAHCRSKGLIFMAYCPLARGGIFNDPVLGEIAKAKGRTIAQIALRWLIQQDIVAPIPRSGDAKHMRESLDVFDFTLSADEMQRIHALKRADGRIANPAGRAPAWD
ncbi:MAG: aldo/keto reductase [Betaproteobacteria bacterium]